MIIKKFQIEIKEYQTISVPKGSRILYAQSYRPTVPLVPNPYIFVLIFNENTELIEKHIHLLSTDTQYDTLPNLCRFINTMIHNNDAYHVFEAYHGRLE